MKFLIFDFEVFKYDILLGVYNLKTKKYFQTWNIAKIKEFYHDNMDAVWFGHNNEDYDNLILNAIIKDKNVYEISKDLIEHRKRHYQDIKMYYYDLMSGRFVSLKVLEAFDGKNISESSVNFDIDRPLTDEEKLETESYNRDDLNQTADDLKRLKDEIQLKFDIIKEFNLPLDALHMTQAQIAAAVLKAQKVEGIESQKVEPKLYPQLKIKDKEVLDYYLGQSWSWVNGKATETLTKVFCGTEHKIAAGGIHAGELRHEKHALYLDVSGYYNLIMINYNLLPRSIPEEGKKLYEFMYHEQLRLKKINPVKRNVYKVILLAVFGAQSNKHCEFYDPYQGDLVRLTGEMFLVDLLEKLEGKASVIQSNTDGIMLVPLPLIKEQEIMDVVKEWQERTGFVLKVERIYDIVQRDVNNYMYRDDKGEIHTKGEAVKHWECSESPFATNAYNSKEPLIIGKCIVEYYMNNKLPEKVIEENKSNIRLFQYICKLLSYDYLTFETPEKIEKLQKVNRCFASKQPGVIYKNKDGKHDRYSNLPESVFIHNKSIDSSLENMIDYDYYIRRAYERIEEFKLKPEQLTLF